MRTHTTSGPENFLQNSSCQVSVLYSEYFPARKSLLISELLDGSSLEEDSLLSLLLWFLLSTHGNLNLPSLGNCQVDYS